MHLVEIDNVHNLFLPDLNYPKIGLQFSATITAKPEEKVVFILAILDHNYRNLREGIKKPRHFPFRGVSFRGWGF